MDEREIKAKLIEQIVNGDQHQLDLAREKIQVLENTGLIDFSRPRALENL